MGSGTFDVALDAGGNGGVAGGQGEGALPEQGDQPDEEDPFAGIGEHADDEPLDEWLAMTPEERAAAAQRALDSAGDDADGAPVGSADQQTTLRTPPRKDPRAAAYDAQVDARFAEVEAVRQRSNPAGAPIDASGIAPVVSNEGRSLQALNLDPGLDAPLRDSRGTEVTRSTVLGLILIRNMYIAMASAMANVFDAIRDGDLAYKRDRAAALYQAAVEYERIVTQADAAKAAFDSERTAPRNLMNSDETQALSEKLQRLEGEAISATEALIQATDRLQREYPETFVEVDGLPLWKAMYRRSGEGVEAGVDRVEIYNTYLTKGAADLRHQATVAPGHDTIDELMVYGRPEYASMRNAVRLDGRSAGSTRTDLLMNQVESVHQAFEIHEAVDMGWTKILLASTGIGLVVGGWVILPFSAVAWGCLGVSIVDVAIEGTELVVRYGEARSAEEAGPILGWRSVTTVQDRERGAVGGTVLAAVGVGIDAAVIRSIRVVGPAQCVETGAPGAARLADAGDVSRAAAAGQRQRLRPDDIAYWRGQEAEAIDRARGYGVTLSDATDEKLAQLDQVVQAAERAGVPRSAIDEGLNRIRDTQVSMVNELERSSGTITRFDVAIKDFRIRMVIAEAMDKGFTIITRIEDSAYLAKLGGSQARIQILEPTDLNRLIAKASVDRVPGATRYTTQEADLARGLLREQDATKLYVFDPQQAEGGLYRLLDADDLASLRRIFGPDAPRPPTIVDASPAGPPPDLPPRQIDPEADTNLDMLDPSMDRTPTQVLRPGEIEDAALNAETVRLRGGAGRAECPPTGPCGPNEIIPHSADPARFIRWQYGSPGSPAADAYERAVRELGAESVDGIAGGYAQGRARTWSWPQGTSYLDAKRMDKFGGELYDPAIVARMPPDVQRAYATARELGAEGLPSDLDIAVDAGIDAGRLDEVAKKIYDDTGVLIEFTDSRIRAAAGPSEAGALAPPPPGHPTAGTPVSSATSGVVDPATSEGMAMLGGPSGRGGTGSPVEIVILSTAGSTGPVMEAFFVNHGEPVRIAGEGIVLEPVAAADPATLRRVEEIRAAALQGKPVPPPGGDGAPGGSAEGAGSPVVRIVLDAYCLQADLDVPTQGMLFRIADPARQTDSADLPAILDASRQLYDQGALDASNNPEDYFHSIRQWAIWAEEKDMDAEEFVEAFVKHAERNFGAAGQPWNAEVEDVVRDYAPGRWRDIEAVLDLAGVR